MDQEVTKGSFGCSSSGNSNTINVRVMWTRFRTQTNVISKNCVMLIAFSHANFAN